MRATTLCATILSLTLASAVALAQTPPPASPTPGATDKQAVSKACSDQANAKGLHGKERKKFRRACMRRGGTPQ
jgi:hypothetical protein